MQIDTIIETLIEKQPGVGQFVFKGRCSVCGKEMILGLQLSHGSEPGIVQCAITGGAGFGFDPENPVFFTSMKCEPCYGVHGKTEYYSRCVGYLRPVENWNAGKQAEFKSRKMFDRSVRGGASGEW